MSTPDRVAALIGRMTGLDDRWRGAVHAVPRHRFVPERAWCAPEDGPGYLIDRGADPDGWLSAAYADAAIITQAADGAVDVTDGDAASSSLSAPGIVLAFLDLLDPYAGDEVLEIGTGTGWTAGLLAHHLGDDNVTSVEIDRDVSAAAGENLRKVGRSPHLGVGDGVQGWAEGALFDRVHVTVGVCRVPHAWVEQTRPGGVLVFPWMPEWEGGHRVRLTVARDGTAVGRFHGGCGFMMLRSQRPPVPHVTGEARESSTDLDPRRVVRASTGADVAVAAMLPGVYGNHRVDGRSFDLWLWSGDSDAHVHYDPGYKHSAVRQRGSRDLWDELHDAFLRWVGWGSPGRDRFGMTVTPEGQVIWLDSPERRVGPTTMRA